MTFEALNNPVTGEYGILRQPALEPGSITVADLYAHPGAAVAYEHIHPGMTETFTVVRGKLTLKKDGLQASAMGGNTLTIDLATGTAKDQPGPPGTVRFASLPEADGDSLAFQGAASP
jgi:hypothetical protein